MNGTTKEWINALFFTQLRKALNKKQMVLGSSSELTCNFRNYEKHRISSSVILVSSFNNIHKHTVSTTPSPAFLMADALYHRTLIP